MTTLTSQIINHEIEGQYSPAKILGIWAIVALPMPILAYVVTPAIASRVDLNSGIVLWLLMILGMVWQFVVSLTIVYGELGTLRWSAIRERTWLNKPCDPHTGKPKLALFGWLVPTFLFAGLVIFVIDGYLQSAMAWLFPSLLRLPSLSLEQATNTRVCRGMVACAIGTNESCFQLLLRGRVSLSRCAAAKDAGCFWQMGLGHERRSIWHVSPA